MEHKLEILEGCPMCGSKEFVEAHGVKDYSTSNESFTICRCNTCGLHFTNPRPNSDSIGAYYESEMYISHTNQKKGLFAQLYQYLRNKALVKKHGWINRYISTGTLVDYGSGTGEFLHFCANQNWKTIGFEIAEGPRNLAKKNYGLDVRDPKMFSDLPNESVDVLTMWHVLEHVGELTNHLNTVSDKLKINGLFVLALPNLESWDAKKYQEYWAAWDVPIHFYHFSKENIKFMAQKFGFEIVEIINMPYDAYYVSLLSEEYKSGKKNWLRALWNGLQSNLKAGKDNASSLTYILRKL